jgi:phosphoglycerate dehydrogenase-like enzyme
MNILYNDVLEKTKLEEEFGYQRLGLEELLERSDFVTLHVPLTEDTRGLIGAVQLAQMKPTAYLVNASRGMVVDEAALIQALQQGQIAGAALDVFETEPIDPENPLLQLDNVVTTPHIASATAACRSAMVKLAVDNVVSFLREGRAITPVNPEIVAT